MNPTQSKLNSNEGEVYTDWQMKMHVQKRGSRGFEPVKFDKITERVAKLCGDLDRDIDPTRVSHATIKNLYDGITTENLDKISANIAESYKLSHPDYSKLAARILISNLHKTTPNEFSICMDAVADTMCIRGSKQLKFIEDNAAALNAMIITQNDYNFDYFGYKTMENSYLIKIVETVAGPDGAPIFVDSNGKMPVYKMINDRPVAEEVTLHPKTTDRIMDRPQYMFMRVAIAIYMDKGTLADIAQCYTALSEMYFTHATPTLFNACGKVQQLNSCFLMGTNDSIEGIMKNLSDTSFISKWAGGIGIHMHNIRCQNSRIAGTNGKSSGLPKQLKIYNEAARCWDQGGKRLGAFSIYLEPWHGDIMKFLELKLNSGAETERARDLFYALWVNDLFVKRVIENGSWSLFSEDSAPGLSDVYDGMMVCTKCDCAESSATAQCIHDFKPKNVFEELYTRYEKEGRAVKVVKARAVMDAINHMQRESGTPYICFKDHVNRMSGQSNIGTIKSSNLCAEIVEWSSAESYACCTLASINLKKFIIVSERPSMDYAKLHEVVRLIARNLDMVIDVNAYPIRECETNSANYRPIGIGIQALADVFAIARIPFLSAEAATMDLCIMETIYHAALVESCARARTHGAHTAFEGSPASQGRLHFDMWLENQRLIGGELSNVNLFSGLYDWDALKTEIKQYGLRNSLHVALMPTVSTSQIMGNNESFEPFASNIYTKTTIAGKFTVANNAMIRHLIELGIWTEDLKNRVVNNDGSVAGISEIPMDIQRVYQTVWDMKQSDLMKRAALRGAFVDQAQSLNIHVRNNSDETLRSIFTSGWKLGLKTGSYYIRTRPGTNALKNNIATVKAAQTKTAEAPVCYMDEGCVHCSS